MSWKSKIVSCELNWYSNISYDFSVLYRKVKKNFYASKHKNFSVRENETSVSFNGFYRDLFWYIDMI